MTINALRKRKRLHTWKGGNKKRRRKSKREYSNSLLQHYYCDIRGKREKGERSSTKQALAWTIYLSHSPLLWSSHLPTCDWRRTSSFAYRHPFSERSKWAAATAARLSSPPRFPLVIFPTPTSSEIIVAGCLATAHLFLSLFRLINLSYSENTLKVQSTGHERSSGRSRQWMSFYGQ